MGFDVGGYDTFKAGHIPHFARLVKKAVLKSVYSRCNYQVTLPANLVKLQQCKL